MAEEVTIHDVELGEIEVIPENATKKEKALIEERVAKRIARVISEK